MTFAWPAALFGLLLVPCLAGAYAWMTGARRRYRLRYSSTSLVRQAAEDHRVRRHLPAALYLLSLTAMFVAIARPTSVIVTARSNATVMLVMDVSGSMRSADIQPSRIEAAKAAVRDFVARQPRGMRIGLVAFAENAYLVTPPTEDKKTVQEAVATLGLGRGTNIGDGLRLGLRAILEPDNLEPGFRSINPAQPTPTPATHLNVDPDNAVMILLSDGAATTGPQPLRVAEEVAAARIKTYTVGLGTTTGASFQTQPQFGGFGGRFMELDEPTLRGIADATGGQYFTAENSKQLKDVYAKLSRKTSFTTEKTEVTFVVTGVAMIFMLAGAVAGMIWSNRLP
jgi:Ca-activated chloride channel family protein